MSALWSLYIAHVLIEIIGGVSFYLSYLNYFIISFYLTSIVIFSENVGFILNGSPLPFQALYRLHYGHPVFFLVFLFIFKSQKMCWQSWMEYFTSNTKSVHPSFAQHIQWKVKYYGLKKTLIKCTMMTWKKIIGILKRKNAWQTKLSLYYCMSKKLRLYLLHKDLDDRTALLKGLE